MIGHFDPLEAKVFCLIKEIRSKITEGNLRAKYYKK